MLSYNKVEITKEYSTNDDRLADDLFLIPQIIEKTILLKLIPLAEDVYDPISTTQTELFSKLMSSLIEKFPTLNSKSSNVKVIHFFK